MAELGLQDRQTDIAYIEFEFSVHFLPDTLHSHSWKTQNWVFRAKGGQEGAACLWGRGKRGPLARSGVHLGRGEPSPSDPEPGGWGGWDASLREMWDGGVQLSQGGHPMWGAPGVCHAWGLGGWPVAQGRKPLLGVGARAHPRGLSAASGAQGWGWGGGRAPGGTPNAAGAMETELGVAGWGQLFCGSVDCFF